MSEVRKDYEIINKLGLHARAAATLVRVASQFESQISLSRKGMVVDGKSILGMMTLAAARGSVITVMCSGPDQQEAIDAIGRCINERFGEDE